MKDFEIKDNIISMDKKYRTRDGRKVKIICTARKSSDYPVVALIENYDGFEAIITYTKDGKRYLSSLEREDDLIEVRPVPDKALVRCWDNSDSEFVKIERFYDAKNNCTFDLSGERKGPAYDNYEVIEHEPVWAKKARKNLKD